MIHPIDKSLTDYKNYRIVLLENNIKAILISDIKPGSPESPNEHCHDNFKDEIQKSAAAICINVGGFDDPVECQGLAHLLEHMVFMGSKKYPVENDFDSSVSQYGGSSDAWTDSETTLFCFDSHFEYFEELMDKFANFFISPLILKDSIDREMAAIHSEFELGYYDDKRRVDWLLQSTSKPDSPYQNFLCGNLNSLKCDSRTRKNRIYKYLKEFRRNMYLSQWMTLAVQSRDSLDNLERVVRLIFSKIPGNDLSKPDSSPFYKPFETNDFSRFYYVVPMEDIKMLNLVWSLPSMISYYKSKPLNILAHFIGYEGQGSLTAYLKKMNFILYQTAGNNGSGFELSSLNSFFTISITLTEHGFENVTEIIGIVFTYIDLLKREGIPISLFEEYKQMIRNNFLFMELDDPITMVEKLAVNLQLYECQDVISGPQIVYEYSSELYSEILSYMTPDKVNIMLLSLSNESKADKISKWYDVRYSVRDFTDEELNYWSSSTFIQDLHLPASNRFLASKFDLVELTNGSNLVPRNLVNIEYPELTNYGEIWHNMDTKFRVPKAVINFYVWSPFLSESALNACMTDFVLYAINQDLNTVAYDAKLAGLQFEITFQESCIMIYLDGFSDKISLLFQTIIDCLRDFTLDESTFLVYKEFLRQYYQNMIFDMEYLAELIEDKLFYPEEWLVNERLKTLKTVSLKDLITFHREMFRSTRIKSYFHGNLSKNDAQLCFVYCVDNLKMQTNQATFQSFVRQISVGQSRVRVMNLDPYDNNTFISIYYQIGVGTLEMETINELLSSLLSEPCFNFLRTQETLGYFVKLTETNNRGILGISISVNSQASTFSTDHCINKITTFFETLALEVIENLSDNDFNDFKASFIANKSVEDIQMSDIATRNWTEIFDEEFVFDRNVKQVEFIKNVSKSDLLNFFVDRYLKELTERKLIIEIDVNKNSNQSTFNDIYDIPLQFLTFEPNKDSVDIDDIISYMDIIESHPIIT